MNADDTAELLRAAAADLRASRVDLAEIRAGLDTHYIPREEAERRHSVLLRILFGVAAALLLVLLILLPLATRNSRNLARTTETLGAVQKTLAIVERVTGPEEQGRSGARLGLAICELKNGNHALHGSGPAPGCSPEEMAALMAAAGLSTP